MPTGWPGPPTSQRRHTTTSRTLQTHLPRIRPSGDHPSSWGRSCWLMIHNDCQVAQPCLSFQTSTLRGQCHQGLPRPCANPQVFSCFLFPPVSLSGHHVDPVVQPSSCSFHPSPCADLCFFWQPPCRLMFCPLDALDAAALMQAVGPQPPAAPRNESISPPPSSVFPAVFTLSAVQQHIPVSFQSSPMYGFFRHPPLALLRGFVTLALSHLVFAGPASQASACIRHRM